MTVIWLNDSNKFHHLTLKCVFAMHPSRYWGQFDIGWKLEKSSCGSPIVRRSEHTTEGVLPSFAEGTTSPVSTGHQQSALTIRERAEPWYVCSVQRRMRRCEMSVTTVGWVTGVWVKK